MREEMRKRFGCRSLCIRLCLAVAFCCVLLWGTALGVRAMPEPAFPQPVNRLSEAPEGFTAIKTIEGLNAIRDNRSGNYILMNDIDLTRQDTWEPISSFSGKLYGNGYKIVGLKGTLIKTIQSGEVRDLGLADVNINSSDSSGALASKVSSGSKARTLVNNIYVSGLVTGKSSTGGVIGRVDGNNSKQSIQINGLANYAFVLAEGNRIGGVIGEVESSTTSLPSIGYLYNYGIVRGTTSRIGGVIGYVFSDDKSLSMYTCKNEGRVIGKEDVGGIIGHVCSKTSIANTSIAMSGYQNSGLVKGSVNVGGIVGYMEVSDANSRDNAKIALSSCMNVGEIDCGSDYTGGIVGCAKHTFSATVSQATRIQNCVSRGKMRSGGNIVGRALLASGTMAISKCVGIQLYDSYVRGIISSASGTNGMNSGRCTLSDCYWLNTVSKIAYETGGKVGGSAKALDGSQAKQQESYPGLSFGSLWAIGGGKHDGYPYLQNAETLVMEEKAPSPVARVPKNDVTDMLNRIGKNTRPYEEFELPPYLGADYDDHLGFSVKATAFLSGKTFTQKQLWVNTYENVLEDIFMKDQDFLDGLAGVMSTYSDEYGFAKDFLDIFDETICKDIPAFQVAGGISDIMSLVTAQAQDGLARCVVSVKYLTYIAEHTDDANLKKAAENIRDRKCSKELDVLVGKAVDFGKSMGVKGIEKAARAAAQKSWGLAAKGAGTLAGSLGAVFFILDVKDLAYNLTGADKTVEAYYQIYAARDIRELFYGCYLEAVKGNKWVEVGETFNLIEVFTKDMYNRAETLLGKTYGKVQDSDSSYKKQVKALPGLNIKNYVKVDYPLMVPKLGAKTLYVAQGTTEEIPLKDCRYDVIIKYETKDNGKLLNKIFSVDSKGRVKAAKNKTGSGTVTVTVQQNAKKYELELKVKVVTAEEKKALDADAPPAKKDKDVKVVKKDAYTVPVGAKAFTVKLTTKSKGKVTFKSDNKKVAVVDGKGKVTVKGYGVAKIKVTVAKSGKYPKQTQTVTVKVVPKTLKAPKVKKGKKGVLTVSWKKDKKVSGYQIRYSLKGNMKEAKTVKVPKAATASAKLKKLKSGKKYYIQIRAYKKAGKTMLYGKWSKKTSGKCK